MRNVKLFSTLSLPAHRLHPANQEKINRKPELLESPVSHRKQRTVTQINRKLSHGPRFPFSPFTFPFSDSASLLRQRLQFIQFTAQIHKCTQEYHGDYAKEDNRGRRHRPAAHLFRACEINCRERRQESGQRQRHHHYSEANAFNRRVAIPSAIRAVRAFGGVFGAAMAVGTS
jgi:hypothetical protein